MSTGFYSRLMVHSAACFVYIVLVWAVFYFYRYFGGVVSSRDVAAGMASQLVFYCVVVSNVLMIAIPRIATRLIITFITGSSIFLYLVPEHPIRAIALTLLAIAVTITAILAPVLGLKKCSD